MKCSDRATHVWHGEHHLVKFVDMSVELTKQQRFVTKGLDRISLAPSLTYSKTTVSVLTCLFCFYYK